MSAPCENGIVIDPRTDENSAAAVARLETINRTSGVASGTDGTRYEASSSTSSLTIPVNGVVHSVDVPVALQVGRTHPSVDRGATNGDSAALRPSSMSTALLSTAVPKSKAENSTRDNRPSSGAIPIQEQLRTTRLVAEDVVGFGRTSSEVKVSRAPGSAAIAASKLSKGSTFGGSSLPEGNASKSTGAEGTVGPAKTRHSVARKSRPTLPSRSSIASPPSSDARSEKGWDSWHAHVRATTQPANPLSSLQVQQMYGACGPSPFMATEPTSPVYAPHQFSVLSDQPLSANEQQFARRKPPPVGPVSPRNTAQESIAAVIPNRTSDPGAAAVLKMTESSWTAHSQAAASAAEHHLNWRMNNAAQTRDLGNDSDRQQRDIWLRHCTAALARGTTKGAISNAVNGDLDVSSRTGTNSLAGSSELDLSSRSEKIRDQTKLHQGHTHPDGRQGERSRVNELQGPYTKMLSMAGLGQAMAADTDASRKRSRSLSSGQNNDVNLVSQRRRSGPDSSDRAQPTAHNSFLSPGNVTTGTAASFPYPVGGVLLNYNTMADAVGRALDDTMQQQAEPAATKPSAGRRVDTPMTYLVRQLLGQVEVVGDEPAVVLGPHLVKEASHKIRLVINKLVEIAVEKAKRESQAIRDVESPLGATEAAIPPSSANSAADVAVRDFLTRIQHQRNIDALKQFAQGQVIKGHEQQLIIDDLQQKLDKNLALLKEQQRIEQGESSKSTNVVQSSNSTVRNLIKQLDGGIAMVQRQKKEIENLNEQVRKNSSSLDEKDNVIKVLRDQLGLEGPTGGEARDATESDKLRKEVRDLEEALSQERRQGEQSIRAYMRAAVHGLKVRSLDDGE